MQRHSWREQTEDGLRFYRASYHAGRWKLDSRLKEEDEWSPHDPITREEWELLRDLLWRKYQRRRCPWKLIAQIDKRLEDEPGEGGDGRSS